MANGYNQFWFQLVRVRVRKNGSSKIYFPGYFRSLRGIMRGIGIDSLGFPGADGDFRCQARGISLFFPFPT